MKTLSHVTTRRDRCYLYGRRGRKLTPAQAADAWRRLSEKLEEMGSFEIPKFNDLLIAFRKSTMLARRTKR